MGNVVKVLGISLLVMGLVACDNASKNDGTTQQNASKIQSSPAGSAVSLLEGKVTFTLPMGLIDQSEKFKSQANNMYAYTNKDGQQAVIVIFTQMPTDPLDVLSHRLIEQQKIRDNTLQVLSDKSINLDGQSVQQVNSIQSDQGASYYSSIVLAKVGEQLMTMQVSLPANNPQEASTIADSVFNTLKIKS